MQAPAPHAVGDRGLGEPERPELLAGDHTTLEGREPSKCWIPVPFDDPNPPHPVNLPTFDDFWSSSGPKTPHVGDRKGCDEL